MDDLFTPPATTGGAGVPEPPPEAGRATGQEEPGREAGETEVEEDGEPRLLTGPLGRAVRRAARWCGNGNRPAVIVALVFMMATWWLLAPWWTTRQAMEELAAGDRQGFERYADTDSLIDHFYEAWANRSPARPLSLSVQDEMHAHLERLYRHELAEAGRGGGWLLERAGIHVPVHMALPSVTERKVRIALYAPEVGRQRGWARLRLIDGSWTVVELIGAIDLLEALLDRGEEGGAGAPAGG